MKPKRLFPANSRSGAATVEFALVASIFFLMVIACVEFARMNTVRHTLANVTYAASRHVIVPGASIAEARAKADAILESVGIVGATITFIPDTIDEATPFVTTKIEIPCKDNSIGVSVIFGNRTMSSESTLMTERAPIVQAQALPTVVNPPPPPPPPEVPPTPPPEPPNPPPVVEPPPRPPVPPRPPSPPPVRL